MAKQGIRHCGRDRENERLNDADRQKGLIAEQPDHEGQEKRIDWRLVGGRITAAEQIAVSGHQIVRDHPILVEVLLHASLTAQANQLAEARRQSDRENVPQNDAIISVATFPRWIVVGSGWRVVGRVHVVGSSNPCRRGRSR